MEIFLIGNLNSTIKWRDNRVKVNKMIRKAWELAYFWNTIGRSESGLKIGRFPIYGGGLTGMWAKTHTADRILLNEHFHKSFVKISAMAWQYMQVFNSTHCKSKETPSCHSNQSKELIFIKTESVKAYVCLFDVVPSSGLELPGRCTGWML